MLPFRKILINNSNPAVFRLYSDGIVNKLVRSFLLLFLLQFILFPLQSLATEVIMTENVVRVDYGQHHHDEIFKDTLTFRKTGAGENNAVIPFDAEVTCECIGFEIIESSNNQPSGALIISFHVEPAEPLGKIEKVLYLFTEDDEYNMVRLLLNTTVIPHDQVIQPSTPKVLTSSPATKGDYSIQPEKSKDVYSKIDQGLQVDPVKQVSDETLLTTEVAQGANSVDGDNAPNLDLNETRAQDQLAVYFFRSPGCQSCRRVKDIVLPYLERQYGDRIQILNVNIDGHEGFARLLAMRKHYGEPDRKSPFYFYVGESQILGRKNLKEKLNSAIQKAISNEETTYKPSPESLKAPDLEIKNVFKSITLWAVIGAGLLDGINPCAFATMIFFISLLGYTGSSKSQMLTVGIGFTASVFAVYLLLGLGAFRALQALALYGIIAKIIYAATFILLMILFAISVRDTYRFYSGGRKTTDQVLQLSKTNKRRIHQVMKRGLKTRNLLLGAMGIGALVSLFEAACTGQVYLPTIVLVLNDPELRKHALLYLVSYNLLFITPLVIVFLLAYGGVASERFADWSKRNFGTTRIALSLLFLIFAIILGVEWFRI